MQPPIFLDFFLHVDMDAFFAAIEQRDNVLLQGKPIIVCGSSPTRAVVSTCSYEAREYGIHSAMSLQKALKLCPQATIIRGKMKHYREVSSQLMQVLQQFSHQVEPLSVDEAFLRIIEPHTEKDVQILIAKIKDSVWQSIALTCSIGVASNKFLAKLASGQNKPNGCCIILPKDGMHFLSQLPLSGLYGVGPSLQRQIMLMGIQSTKDLQEASLLQLQQSLGVRQAWHLYQLVRGVDPRGKERRIPRHRTLAKEITFDHDMQDWSTVEKTLGRLVYQVWYRILNRGESALTIRVKIKYANFQERQQQITVSVAVASAKELYIYAQDLLRKVWDGNSPIRLIGVSLGSLHKNTARLLLIEPLAERERIIEQIGADLYKQEIMLIRASFL
ncbi:DNA polymerase IV [Entomospira entomophila]|uniref:DNA polymerase IV n=1 Tax=Entomospira entomophila TaxID=2719988 RepID=A0A968G7F1_9SPIO|nr:DNA polymerase IV [Entomospira entomophilus]NIZ39995.1 DNA polymerase IV [Entomospira entomophilus]WDI35555.1 DNA polymerase IV [Entomospira entomophilus]